MVIVDFEDKVVEGTLNPSSDTPTHRRLFLAFSDIRSVVHTHSRKAVAFAQAAREIPLLGTTHAEYFRGPVPLTRALTPDEIASAYEWETGNVIVECLANSNPNDIPAVLVRNHGPFAWGPSAAKAFENALALEIVADMAFHTLTLNPKVASPAPRGSIAPQAQYPLKSQGAGPGLLVAYIPDGLEPEPQWLMRVGEQSARGHRKVMLAAGRTDLPEASSPKPISIAAILPITTNGAGRGVKIGQSLWHDGCCRDQGWEGTCQKTKTSDEADEDLCRKADIQTGAAKRAQQQKK